MTWFTIKSFLLFSSHLPFMLCKLINKTWFLFMIMELFFLSSLMVKISLWISDEKLWIWICVIFRQMNPHFYNVIFLHYYLLSLLNFYAYENEVSIILKTHSHNCKILCSNSEQILEFKGKGWQSEFDLSNMSPFSALLWNKILDLHPLIPLIYLLCSILFSVNFYRDKH